MKIVIFVLAGLALCCAYDYGDVIRKSLLFYEAQRSGKLPADQKVTWRKDSALNDKGQNGEDLTGGYYDAGDFVKFGFTMAYTATVLSWGIVSHEAGYNKANALTDARKAVKWATDYFIKAHVKKTTFYGQVGKGELDHDYWGRPEDMKMERPAYKIDTSNPGSDLAAETAAALAAASIVFKNSDPGYSSTLLSHAKELYNFADKYRGKYSNSIKDAKEYYESSDYKDELVWGAAWLYKATGDKSYLTKAENYYDQFGLASNDDYFDWDGKSTGAKVLLAQLTGNSKYKNKVKSFCDDVINNQKRTPKGLVYLNEWATLNLAANAAYVCLEAANMGINANTYRSFAKQQINYMLGDGGRSYVVGFGKNPPTHEQHASSSCPDKPAKCDWDTFEGSQPNAHVLYGALVGGPDKNDKFTDVRSDYVHNEVACDYNAGFQSALAALLEL